MDSISLEGRHRLTQKQKDANDKQWYKDQINLLDSKSLSERNFSSFDGVSDYKRMKVNYDLFNSIVNIRDFNYVCKPFGDQVGELPANFENRDIVSGKIKVLLGMEMKMPFSWKVVAVNEEATTRKEEEEFNKIRDFVVGQIMQPIKAEAEKQARAQTKGKQLTPEEEQDIEEEINSQVEAQTPDKVRLYMTREHQDPAEALSRQLLQYLIPAKRILHKFNKAFKHFTLSGTEVFWVGARNGEPDVEVVNTLHFDYDKSPDTDFIEDGEWACREIRMTPSEVVANFGSQLTEVEIDKIYEYNSDPTRVADIDFSFNNDPTDGYTIRVLHGAWKSLRLVKFLTYYDKGTGKPEQTLVDENYKLNPVNGDIRLEREWIPEVHECYKIMNDIYVYARPVPGQHKDIDNLWESKLPYYGASFDNLNSPITSPMDRMKSYQYLHNIILYRIELLMASDQGKIIAANINSIPSSVGIDTKKWHYFMKANKVAWFNPNEEGNKHFNGDIGSVAKVLDLSLISEIDKYMNLANEMERKCGAAVGVTPQMEAQITASEAVTNAQQNLVQASYIVQPYYELHNTVKANVLQAFLDTAKDTYAQSRPRKLTYVLDDVTYNVLIDPDLLENSRYGLFVANSSKAADAKRAVEQLAQAALQNQQADLSDIIKVIKADSINEAEELLEAGEARQVANSQAMEKQKMKMQKQAEAAQSAKEERDHNWRLEEIKVKEEERRETELQKQAMLSVGFDTNKDEDSDGQPDVMEIYKHGLDAEIKRGNQAIDQEKLGLEKNKFSHQQQMDAHQKQVDKEKLDIDKKKAQAAIMKKASKN